MNEKRGTVEYYVKSRQAEDYKKMLLDSLYHPPIIKVDTAKSTDTVLYLNHVFEGKQLVTEYIPDVLLGIEYLWSGCSGGNYEVKLETTEIYKKSSQPGFDYKEVQYSIKEKKVTKKSL